MNGSIVIGISFGRMETARKKISKALDAAQDESDNLSRAASSLEVDDGRLRQKAETLSAMRSRINSRMAELQRMNEHIDYAVQRFQKTDELCAKSMKTGSYEVRKSLGLVKEGGIFGEILGGLESVVSKGKAAWDNITKSVSDWYEKNKVLINNMASVTFEAMSIVLTVAAVSALTVTGAGLVVILGIAAAGIVYSASNIVDSGAKIYNYCTTGEEKGFNFVEKSFQSAFGNEIGSKAYNYTGLAIGVADMAAGAGLIGQAKNVKNELKIVSNRNLNKVDDVSAEVRAAIEGTLKSGADNIANGPKLNAQLSFEEASSVFTKGGSLKPEVIKNSSKIDLTGGIKDPNVIKELTKNGSTIDQWSKMTTQSFKSPNVNGEFQVHFYQNQVTGEISNYGMKSVFNIR